LNLPYLAVVFASFVWSGAKRPEDKKSNLAVINNFHRKQRLFSCLSDNLICFSVVSLLQQAGLDIQLP